jgi:hypothetical protein
VNWFEFLGAGIILIIIFFLLLLAFFEIFLMIYGGRVCSMTCKEFKSSNFHKFNYLNLKCECCNLINGSLECESIWKK